MKALRTIISCALLLFAGSMLADNLQPGSVEVKPGERATVSVAFDTPATEYIMVEFWLSLPQGISIPMDEDGYFLADGNGDRFKRTHVLEVSEQGGNYHFLIYSSRNEAFKGTSGELFNFTIEAASDIAPGNYQGRIFNQLYNDVDKNEYTPGEVTFAINVPGGVTPPPATTNVLSVADLAISAGERKTVSVAFENPTTEFIMIEFWLSLPQGVSIPLDEDGYYLAEGNSNRFKRTHVLEVSEQGGNYHFLIYSSRNEAFKGTSGELFNFTIEASSNITAGNYQGKIFNQLYNDVDKNEYTPDDVFFGINMITEDISTTEVNTSSDSDQPVYNLNGTRVLNPQRGVYIRNGKKFVVK